MYIKEINAAFIEKGFHELKNLEQSRQLQSRHMSLTDDAIKVDKFNPNVSIHYYDLIEQQNIELSSDISPCINVTFLLSGKLSFKVGDNKYTIDTQDKQAKVILNVINHTTEFTRYMNEKQAVKKITISIKYPWLIERIHSKTEKNQLHKIMNQESNVSIYHCPNDILALAEQYIYNKKRSTLTEQLVAEQLSLALLEKTTHILLSSNISLSTLTRLKNSAPLSNRTGYKDLQTTFVEQFNQLTSSRLNLPQIAKKMGVSVSNLQRKVKCEFNQSAMSYIKAQRLNRAKQLLISEGLSIGEIAYLSGFNHAANFVTAFKKHHGITPAKYRQTQNKRLTV